MSRRPFRWKNEFFTLYLAGPFFTAHQKEVASTVGAVFASIRVFDPRKHPQLDTGATPQEVYNNNVEALDTCDLILACIDDFDPGTIWEMGYGHAMGTPIIAYSLVPGRGLNLMLRESVIGFLSGLEQLKQLATVLKHGRVEIIHWAKYYPTSVRSTT